MNTSKSKKIIGYIIGFSILTALIIVENSKIISAELKSFLENAIFVSIIAIVMFFLFYNEKDKPNLKELEEFSQPVEPYKMRLAERLALKKSRIESLMTVGSLIYVVGLFYIYRTHDDHSFALMVIWILPLSLIPLTWHMVVSYQLQKLKEKHILQPVDPEKLLKPSGRILVDYAITLLMVTDMWLGGFEILDPIGYPIWLLDIRIAIGLLVLLIVAGAWLMNFKAPELPKED